MLRAVPAPLAGSKHLALQSQGTATVGRAQTEQLAQNDSTGDACPAKHRLDSGGSEGSAENGVAKYHLEMAQQQPSTRRCGPGLRGLAEPSPEISALVRDTEGHRSRPVALHQHSDWTLRKKPDPSPAIPRDRGPERGQATVSPRQDQHPQGDTQAPAGPAVPTAHGKR